VLALVATVNLILNNPTTVVVQLIGLYIVPIAHYICTPRINGILYSSYVRIALCISILLHFESYYEILAKCVTDHLARTLLFELYCLPIYTPTEWKINVQGELSKQSELSGRRYRSFVFHKPTRNSNPFHTNCFHVPATFWNGLPVACLHDVMIDTPGRITGTLNSRLKFI